MQRMDHSFNYTPSKVVAVLACTHHSATILCTPTILVYASNYSRSKLHLQ